MTSSEAFLAMTCKELKIELKKRDLPTSGLKRDLLDRLHEAESATLIDEVNTTNNSGSAEACSNIVPIERLIRPAWELPCLMILCACLFFASWRVMILAVGNYEDALNAQDLTWLNYPDHYKVLDVPANASSTYIRRAYRQKAKKWHPDRATTMNISQEILYKATRIIGLSRDVLLDPRDRQLYDMGSNPAKCESSCELCTCSCGDGARLSSCNPSNRLSCLSTSPAIQGAKTGALFVLKMAFYGAVYSYRLPECWIWHWDLPLWDKQRCTAHPLDTMWSEARSIQERCKLECDDKWYAAENLWNRHMRDACEKTCKQAYRAESR